MATQNLDRVYIWDRFVRLFHWSLVLAFAVAFATGEGPANVHQVAGYSVAGLVAARLVWGFVGPAHARFSDFAYPPGEIFRYLRDLVLMRSRRYLGHSPAGGAMIFLLLASLVVTSLSGLWLLGTAPEDEALEELHEGLATFTLVLVSLHLCGVVLASFAHRENLPAAMISGFKRP